MEKGKKRVREKRRERGNRVRLYKECYQFP